MRDKILAQAIELYTKHGIKSISLDDIARSLSISKKTIYQYFKDKDELIIMITSHYLDRLKSEIDSVDADANNALDRIEALTDCMRRHHEEVNDTFIFDLRKYHPVAWHLFESFKKEVLIEMLKSTLEQGKRQGFFREEIDSGILAALRLEQIQLAFDSDIFRNSDYKPSDIQCQFYNHFVHGLLTEKGREVLIHKTKTIQNLNKQNY
ncbi:MAG: TetR/AcrR family transcriptional regulator [Cyclobacteriaceae bacterium]|nr:TetR/AcrR family transcriptional regulator [Cyclobacteriaceae bacterium]